MFPQHCQRSVALSNKNFSTEGGENGNDNGEGANDEGVNGDGANGIASPGIGGGAMTGPARAF